MLSASCSRVTTCAVGAARPCACSTADLQQPHRGQLDDAPERRAQRVGEPVRRTRSRAIAGRIGPADDRARATSRPGSAGSTIGIDPTHARRYSASTVPTSKAAGPGAGELPVDQQHARPAPRARARRARGSCPNAGRRARARRRRRRSAAARAGAHRSRLAWMRATRSWAAALRSSTSSCGGSGSDSAHMRSTPGDGSTRVRREPMQGRQRAAERPRPGCAGSVRGGRPSRGRRPACAGRACVRRVVMDDARAPCPPCPASRPAARRTAASCASVSARRAVRLLDDERRAGARGGEEHAVPARHVDDDEILLHDVARLDKAERQEIVGDV